MDKDKKRQQMTFEQVLLVKKVTRKNLEQKPQQLLALDFEFPTLKSYGIEWNPIEINRIPWN